MKRKQDAKELEGKRIQRIHFENQDMVALILSKVDIDGRRLLQLEMVSQTFYGVIRSHKYDELIWKPICLKVDPFINATDDQERFWFLCWKTRYFVTYASYFIRAVWKFAFPTYISSHHEVTQATEYQLLKANPQEYFCFVIRATCCRTDDESDLDSHLLIGESKFGGYPDLPKLAVWPRSGMNFKGQINIEQVKFYDRYNILPENGILYFFSSSKGDRLSTEAVLHFSKSDIERLGGLERRKRKNLHSSPLNIKDENDSESNEDQSDDEIAPSVPWKLLFGAGVAVNRWSYEDSKKKKKKEIELGDLACQFAETFPELTEDQEHVRYLQFLGPNRNADNINSDGIDNAILSSTRHSDSSEDQDDTETFQRVFLLEMDGETSGYERDSLWYWFSMKKYLDAKQFSQAVCWHYED